MLQLLGTRNLLAKTRNNKKKSGNKAKPTAGQLAETNSEALSGEVERSAVTDLVGIEARSSEFSGPIPSPEMLREYDDLLPGTLIV